MDKIDYTNQSNEELEEQLKELNLRKVKASGTFIRQKEPRTNFSKIRREIAKIKTEINSRGGKNERKKIN